MDGVPDELNVSSESESTAGSGFPSAFCLRAQDAKYGKNSPKASCH